MKKKKLLAWKNEIIKSDCDIIIGYNIFYFDEKYIYERATEHLYNENAGDKISINFISKLKDYECPFKNLTLASSALGENKLSF